MGFLWGFDGGKGNWEVERLINDWFDCHRFRSALRYLLFTKKNFGILLCGFYVSFCDKCMRTKILKVKQCHHESGQKRSLISRKEVSA